MVFSKAIQIKSLVNQFNQVRWENGFGSIDFECHMFSDGQWSVELTLIHSRLFFSMEIEQIAALFAGGGVLMCVAASNDRPIIRFQ